MIRKRHISEYVDEGPEDDSIPPPPWRPIDDGRWKPGDPIIDDCLDDCYGSWG